MQNSQDKFVDEPPHFVAADRARSNVPLLPELEGAAGDVAEGSCHYECGSAKQRQLQILVAYGKGLARQIGGNVQSMM